MTPMEIGSLATYDHLLYSVLSALAKVLSHCSRALTETKHTSMLKELFGEGGSGTLQGRLPKIPFLFHTDRVQELLLHPHSWVRLASSQLFGQLFASCPLEELLTSLVEEKERRSGALQIASRLEVCPYE